MVRELLHKIKLEQGTEGLFRSHRKHPLLKYSREDNNIFFTASIIFILKQVRPCLTSEDQELIGEMIDDAQDVCIKYKNARGRSSYNFWQTHPSNHFPNSNWIGRHNFFKLPDDCDTTSLVYLAFDLPEEDLISFKKKLPHHANKAKLNVKTTFKDSRELIAYSTWLGDRMPIEFDVCVLCNYLYLILENKLDLNDHDLATLEFIVKIVAERRYMKHPFKSSPAYPSSTIIIYHVVRLMAKFDIKSLEGFKAQLLADIGHLLRNAKTMDRMVLHSSQMKLGVSCQDITDAVTQRETTTYSWFTAGFLSAFGNPVAKVLAPNHFFHMQFICPAFNQTLLLESLVLSSKSGY